MVRRNEYGSATQGQEVPIVGRNHCGNISPTFVGMQSPPPPPCTLEVPPRLDFLPTIPHSGEQSGLHNSRPSGPHIGTLHSPLSILGKDTSGENSFPTLSPKANRNFWVLLAPKWIVCFCCHLVWGGGSKGMGCWGLANT